MCNIQLLDYNGQQENCGEVREDKDELTSKSDISILSQEKDFSGSAADVNTLTCSCQSCEARRMVGTCDKTRHVPFQKHCSNCFFSKPCRKLLEYLEVEKDETYWRQYLLPEKVLSRFALLLGKNDNQ